MQLESSVQRIFHVSVSHMRLSALSSFFSLLSVDVLLHVDKADKSKKSPSLLSPPHGRRRLTALVAPSPPDTPLLSSHARHLIPCSPVWVIISSAIKKKGEGHASRPTFCSHRTRSLNPHPSRRTKRTVNQLPTNPLPMVLEGQLREQGRKSDVKACCGGGMKGLLQAMGGGMKGPTGEREREEGGPNSFAARQSNLEAIYENRLKGSHLGINEGNQVVSVESLLVDSRREKSQKWANASSKGFFFLKG